MTDWEFDEDLGGTFAMDAPLADRLTATNERVSFGPQALMALGPDPDTRTDLATTLAESPLFGPEARVRLGLDPEDRYNPHHDNKGKFAKRPGGMPGSSDKKPNPLSDVEFEARQKLVEATLKKHANLATDVTHTDADGTWSAERDELHREIVEELYAKANHVPREGKAVMAGGLGGAGKSTVLRDHAKIDPKRYLTINPDDIKEELIKRDLTPKVPGDLSPLELSPLVHEESSRIAKMLADKAYNDKRNMIWDITMSSESGVVSRIKALRRSGYEDVQGVFVDIPVETSVDRALSRYRRGVDRYRAGEGPGGRYVPPRLIRAQKSGDSSVNRDVFEGNQSLFDSAAVYDNSGSAPKLVSQSGGS